MKFALTFLATLSFAAAANAQIIRRENSDEFAVIAIHNYGQCVVNYTPQGAQGLLSLDYRTPQYAAELRRLAKGHDRCAPLGRLKFSGVLFAGALAEALLKSQRPATNLQARLAFDPRRQAVTARSETETMALCAVLKKPDGVARLFATDPTSAAETAALADLTPTLGECLANGAKAEVNKPAIRALLALAAYRIVTTPRTAQ